MTGLVVVGILLLALAVAFWQGPPRCFGWVYLPTMLLVPIVVRVDLPGLPELTALRAAALGLVAGTALTGRRRMLVPRWRWFDLLPAAAVLSFSISYGLQTDFKGFYHRFAMLLLDWFIPYLLARALMRDRVRAQQVLLPFALAGGVLAFLAVYEARMGLRLGYVFWDALLGIGVPSYWGQGSASRWGFLRAMATFGHPIELGLVFATLAPLAGLLALLQRRFWTLGWGLAVACAAGCVAALSRGPMMVLAGSSLLFTVLARRARPLVLLVLLMLLPAAPLLVDQLSQSMQSAQEDFAERGNTESGRYRLALLLIYGGRIGEAGLFGDPSIIGSEFEKAWSIDNAYLLFYLEGGWVGGTLFAAMTLANFVLAVRVLRRSSGRRRKVVAATMASFAGMAGCMADVWFAPRYSPLFFVVGALLLNQTRSGWFAVRLGRELRQRKGPGSSAAAVPRVSDIVGGRSVSRFEQAPAFAPLVTSSRQPRGATRSGCRPAGCSRIGTFDRFRPAAWRLSAADPATRHVLRLWAEGTHELE